MYMYVCMNVCLLVFLCMFVLHTITHSALTIHSFIVIQFKNILWLISHNILEFLVLLDTKNMSYSYISRKTTTHTKYPLCGDNGHFPQHHSMSQWSKKWSSWQVNTQKLLTHFPKEMTHNDLPPTHKMDATQTTHAERCTHNLMTDIKSNNEKRKGVFILYYWSTFVYVTAMCFKKNTHTHTHTHIYIYIITHTYTHTCMFLYVCMCVYTLMYIYIYIYIYI